MGTSQSLGTYGLVKSWYHQHWGQNFCWLYKLWDRPANRGTWSQLQLTSFYKSDSNSGDTKLL